MFFYISIIFIILLTIYKYKYFIEFDAWYDFLLINRNKNKSKILFYPFVGCGFANKIPTLASTILLSILSHHPLFIINWYEILFYFQLPKIIFLKYYNFSHIKTFNRNNISVLKELNCGLSIKIYTYHSYISYILLFYNLTKKIKRYIQINKNRYKNIEMYIHQIFLIPTPIIYNHIMQFNKLKKNYHIIGVHIRTGYLSDFGERDNRFYDNKSINLYLKKINSLLNYYNNSKIYIVSDSTIIKNYITSVYMNNILNYTIPGKICHARYTMHNGNILNECVVKLISENYILSDCNTIVGSCRSSYFNLACIRKNVICLSIY